MPRWSSTDGVQERILDAAMTVLQANGYSAATMTDIVAEASVSTGSIYHHFGGKEELFAACFSRFRNGIRELTSIDPDADMPAPGEWEKAFLWAIWTHRDDAAIFLSLDVPRGFNAVDPITEYYAGRLGAHSSRLLAAVTLEAMRIVVTSSADEVTEVIDEVVGFIARCAEATRPGF